MSYYGDYQAGQTVTMYWETAKASGESVTRTTNGTVYVKKVGGSQVTTGVTDTEDSPATGIHTVTVVTTDGYFTPGDYSVYGLTMEVDGVTPINHYIGCFSIQNRYVPGLVYRGPVQAGGSTSQVIFPAAANFSSNQLQATQVTITYGPGFGDSRFIESMSGDIATVSPPLTTVLSSGSTSYMEAYGVAPASTSVASATPSNIVAINGNPVPAAAAGYMPSVNKVGTAAGELQLTGGVIRADDRDGNLIGANVMTRLGTPSGASVSSDIAGATVAATSAATAAVAAATAATSADTAATNILTQTVTGTFNVKECFDAMMAVLAGAVTVSDAPGGQKIIVFRDVTNARNALTVVADGTTGARGSVTFNLVP